MWTAGQITQIGSKAGQITGGELRWMEDYLGKIQCIKESLYPRKKIIYLYSFCYAHILKAILEKHPYRVKIPSTILAPSSQNHIKLIDRLSDPPPSFIDQLSPAELCAPSPEPTGSSSPPVLLTSRCFICIRIHRLPNCVPTFCRRQITATQLLKNKHPLTSGHLLQTTPLHPCAHLSIHTLTSTGAQAKSE